MKKRTGIDEYVHQDKGNSFIAAGRVTNHRKVGCPKCDTIYLQLHRDGAEVLFLAMTPEEASIISHQLERMLWA